MNKDDACVKTKISRSWIKPISNVLEQILYTDCISSEIDDDVAGEIEAIS